MLFDSTCSTDNNSPNGASPAPLPWRQPQQQWRQQQAHMDTLEKNFEIIKIIQII